MRFPSRSRKSTIGLDIGSSLVKAVELDFSRSAPELKHLGIVPLPPEAIVDGEIMDRLLVLEAIRECVSAAGIKGKDVVSAVSGRALIVKKVLMDKMDPSDAQEAITWEAEQHVPFDIDDVSLDFQILADDLPGNQMQVLLVAAKKELIHHHADLIRDADLTPLIIDVAAFAVQNCYEQNYDVDGDKVVALLNVGSDVSNLNIIQGGKPQFTRDLSIGRSRFVEEVQRELNVGAEEASQLLSAEEPPDGLDVQQLVNAITSAAEEISLGIERSFAYLKGGGEEARLGSLLLSGGGSQMPRLRKHLAQRHEVPVEVIDPLRTISYDPQVFSGQPVEKTAPLLAVSVGLGLRRVE